MTTIALFIIFFPLSIVILLNALLVPANSAARASTAITGLGILGASVYWGLRAGGWIDPIVPYVDGYRVALVLVAIGLYSVFGAPLFLEIVKRRGR